GARRRPTSCRCRAWTTDLQPRAPNDCLRSWRGDGAGCRARTGVHERPGVDRWRAAQRWKLAVHRWRVCGRVRGGATGAASVDMTAPYFELGYFGARGALVAALVIGIAFGWCLESAGMGSARKLAAQFYLTDLTVFKVMFSAIVTAMLGLFWLGRLGMLDLSRVYVPESFPLPRLPGRLVFSVVVIALAGFRAAEWIERRRRQPSLTAREPDDAALGVAPAPERMQA